MIDKYDVKKAILGGKISLSDVASTSRFTSRPDRYDFGPKIADDRRRQEKSRIPEEEVKKPEMVKAEESGSSKSKEIEQPITQKKSGSGLNAFEDSFKFMLIDMNESQYQKALGKLKGLVIPNMLLVDDLDKHKNNPDFYRYLREYDKIAKKDPVDWDGNKIDPVALEAYENRFLTDEERQRRYEEKLRKERAN